MVKTTRDQCILYWCLSISVTFTFLPGSSVWCIKGHNHPFEIRPPSHDTRSQPKPQRHGGRPFVSQEQCLMRQLMTNYDPSARPVYNPLTAVDVTLGLTVKKILDLDEKNQILTTNIWLEASWYDERLNWSSTKYGGIKSILIPPHKIWLPDIVLYNSVDDYTSGYMPSLAMVYNDSRVFWGPVIRFRSVCKIDITYFPFDNQMCKMKIGSWAYNGLQVNVLNSSSNKNSTNFVDNGEWELLAVQEKRNVVFYSCCKEPYPDVTFTIVLRRKTKYYFMNILIPCILLSSMCLGGFLLPPDSGEKITLGLSVLLTITVFMLMVADRMPQTSESISVISIYLMAVLCTSCMSVLSSVLVLSIHHQRHPMKVPGFLKWLCSGVCGRVFRLKMIETRNNDHIVDPIFSPTSNNGVRHLEAQSTNEADNSDNLRIRQILSKYSRNIDTRFLADRNIRVEHSGHDSTFASINKNHKDNYVEKASKSPSILSSPGRVKNQPSRPAQTSGEVKLQHSVSAKRLAVLNALELFQHRAGMDEITGTVSYLARCLAEKEKNVAKVQGICQEWHNLAYILDRLLCTVFLSLTIISTACILSMRPSHVEL